MKILEVKKLAIPQIKVFKIQRFSDFRGYFTETFRQQDLEKVIPNFKVIQINESYSKKRVFRGLHFQWNPYMAKFIRVIKGVIIDIGLDIRLKSPTYGKAIAYQIKSNENIDFFEAIFLPIGFAHGVYFLEESIIEYYCNSSWDPQSEASINPLSKTIDWSLTDENLKKILKENLSQAIISEKDKQGILLEDWLKDDRSKNFIYSS